MEAEAAASFVVQQKAVAWDGGRAANTAKSGRTISVPIPSPREDPVIRAIEERCAAATGMPIHRDEEPLGVRHTSPSTAAEYDERRCTALHIDTNQGGIYRCATVLIYLHDIERGWRDPVPSGRHGGALRAARGGTPALRLRRHGLQPGPERRVASHRAASQATGRGGGGAGAGAARAPAQGTRRGLLDSHDRRTRSVLVARGCAPAARVRRGQAHRAEV